MFTATSNAKAFAVTSGNVLGNGKYNLVEGLLNEELISIINKINTFGGEIKIPNTLFREKDYENAWRKMGINPKDGSLLKSVLDLEIHHLDNNLETTLQLVTKKAHRATRGHTGSAAQMRHLFDIINNLP